MAHDSDDINLTGATLTRLINSALGSEWICSEDGKAVIHDCCKELVQLLASESNHQLESEKKTRILPSHLIAALEELDYAHWIPEVSEVMNDHATDAKSAAQTSGGAKGVKRKLAASGKTLEELQREQQEKFAQAREKMEQRLREEAAVRQMEVVAAAATSLLQPDEDEDETKQSSESTSKKQKVEPIIDSSFGAL